MSLGHEIRNLIERAHDKVNELHLDNGPQPQIAHSAGRADNGALADRRIDHALPAKPLQQAFAGLERPAVHTDVFADQHDGRVSLHLLEHRLLDGFEKSDLRSVRRAAIRSRHVYLRAFLEAPARAAFTVFFGATFAGALTAGLPASARFVSAGPVSPN